MESVTKFSFEYQGVFEHITSYISFDDLNTKRIWSPFVNKSCKVNVTTLLAGSVLSIEL